VNNWKPSFNPWLVAVSVMLATFMEVLDTTIISVAQPYMAGSLASTNEEATWVLTSYLVANAIVLPASGWLSLRFGRKRFLLACTLLFLVGSLLCGAAPTMGALVLARILQGAGGGALQPLSQAILLESFPPSKRGLAMAMFGLGVVGAPVLGPTLGGWLTDNFSWRWVFYINLPVGALAFYMMTRFVEDPPYVRDAKPGRIDTVGFGLLALWLATMQVVLDKGQQEDWFSSNWILTLSVISAVSLVALIFHELHTPEPIVDLRVFKDRNFWVGSSLITVVSAGMYSSLTILPVYLQTLMGYTAQSAGLATTPRGLGAMLAMPLVGKLLSYVDGRYLIVAGVTLFAISTFMFSSLTLDVSMSSIIWPNVLQGFGMALIFVPNMALAMSTLANVKIGNASGIFNLCRNQGGSIGIAIAVAFVTRFAQVRQNGLVEHLTPYDAVYQARMRLFEMGAGSQQLAHAVMNGLLQQQAYLLAYIDVFQASAVALVVCIPVALLMKKVAMHGNSEMMMH